MLSNRLSHFLNIKGPRWVGLHLRTYLSRPLTKCLH
jgi:hypothetical protein